MIRKFLDLSTAHVSHEARAWLDLNGALEADRNGAGGAHNVAVTRHGWFMWVPDDEVAGSNLHPDLRPIADHARAAGCEYVLFDGDALEIDGLPIYDWEEPGPYRYSADACPSSHWNGGDDVCTDCGKFLG